MASRAHRSPTNEIRPELPADLRRSDLTLGENQYVVLSFASPPSSPILNLSRAESAVARAAAAGQTNAEIAATRGSSVFTIQNQLASVYRKLAVSSRAELCALLVKLTVDTADVRHGH